MLPMPMWAVRSMPGAAPLFVAAAAVTLVLQLGRAAAAASRAPVWRNVLLFMVVLICRAVAGLGLKPADFYVPKPKRAVVVLQGNIPGFEFAVVRRVVPLAAVAPFLPVVRPGVEADYLFAVEPVFGVVLGKDDAAGVPFAGGFDVAAAVHRGGVHGVVGAGALPVLQVGGVAEALVVFRDVVVFGVLLVVDELVFRGDFGGAAVAFADVVQDAAVATGGDFPFQFQLKIIELFGGVDQVFAAFVFGFVGFCAVVEGQFTVLDHPAGGHGFGVVAAPAFGARAIEQVSPVRFLSVFILRGRGCRGFGGRSRIGTSNKGGECE